MERYIQLHSCCTDPTQAAARLVIVLVSWIQKNGTEDNNFQFCQFGPTRPVKSGPSSKLVSNIPVRPNIYSVPFDVPTKCPECWVERNSNSSLGDLWWRRFAEMLVQSVGSEPGGRGGGRGSEWPFKITRYIFINFSQRKQNHTGARQADNFFFFNGHVYKYPLSLSISPTRQYVPSFSFQWA